MDNVRQYFASHGLVRSQDDRILGGVFAGLGRRVGLDPWPARFVFILLLLIIPGSQLLIYPLLWILMPAQGAPAASPAPAYGTPLS